MLSYDPPMPANKGHKDTPNVLAVTNGNVTTLSPSSKPNGASTMNNVTVNPEKHHHIWLVTGPAGCGKTTIAEYLASQLNFPYIEGDSV
jgi:gluconokinase